RQMAEAADELERLDEEQHTKLDEDEQEEMKDLDQLENGIDNAIEGVSEDGECKNGQAQKGQNKGGQNGKGKSAVTKAGNAGNKTPARSSWSAFPPTRAKW